jgi:hypothetical protein
MTPVPALKPCLSVEDYLAGERDGEVRHEYGAGEVHAMAGASDRHGLLAMALGVQPCFRIRAKNVASFSWPI